MSSDQSRTPEKTEVSDPEPEAKADTSPDDPEMSEIVGLLARRAPDAVPKWQPKQTPHSAGIDAAAYAHAPRPLPKGKDTVPLNTGAVLVELTPAPSPSDGTTESGMAQDPARDAPTERGSRPRALVGEEETFIVRNRGFWRTRNVVVAVAFGSAIAFVIALVLRTTRKEPAARSVPTASSHALTHAPLPEKPSAAPEVAPLPVASPAAPAVSESSAPPPQPPPSASPPALPVLQAKPKPVTSMPPPPAPTSTGDLPPPPSPILKRDPL